MHIRHVTISVPDPAETARFLTSLFGFPLDHAHRGESLRLGTSRLSLVEGSMEPNGFYHLAFEIPENTVYAARDLLAARIPILEAGDNGIVAGSPAWDSHSVYFNAPGNLNLELIGRHRLPNAITSPFSLSDILRISEVGVPVEDSLVAARKLQDQTGFIPFGEPSEMFAPVGTDDGLLILVKHGRIWFPTADQTTTRRPLRVEIDGIDGTVVVESGDHGARPTSSLSVRKSADAGRGNVS